jgi:tRNA G10  N-methylase Trm11
VNRAKDRKIMVRVWDFGAVAPQKERGHYACNDHPAKMRPGLARAILQIYGESPVLDPMVGIGTTCVEASLLGMESYGVDYEEKFVLVARKNLKALKGRNLGRATVVRGDARFLSRMFRKKAGSIVFSPPYAGSLSAKKNTKSFMSREERLRWAAGEPLEKRGMNYGPSPGNIGNVSNYGEEVFESIVFSPPYREANRGGGIAKRGYEGKHGRDEGLKDRCDRPLSSDKNNIGNVVYGSTYLGEMFKIYLECYKVLKPGRFMVVVVKDIRRKGCTIPLGADTIRLCQLAGFDCFEVIVNMMYFPSFWMLHHAIKAQKGGQPMALKIHEYVLVFRKPGR